MKDKKVYYWVEISQETSQSISSACETFANLCAGKIDILEQIVINAYKNRTGKDIEEIELEQVRKALKLVQFFGWDTSYGNENKVHGYSDMTDTLFDVSEVLNFQLGVDGIELFKDSKYPLHWNDKMPLCRIVNRAESRYNRRKQLSIFPK